MNFESFTPVLEKEEKVDFLDKHESWFEEAKNKVSRDWRGIALKSLMVLATLSFVQQEVGHWGTNGKYDFKQNLGYGLYLRSKENFSAPEIHGEDLSDPVEDIEDVMNHE